MLPWGESNVSLLQQMEVQLLTPLGVGSSAGSCGALLGALSSFKMPQGLQNLTHTDFVLLKGALCGSQDTQVSFFCPVILATITPCQVVVSLYEDFPSLVLN